MTDDTTTTDNGYLRRRLLEAGFWIVLIALLWTLDTLTQMAVRARTGVGLDDFRLITEQATSAVGALVMVPFVAWWLNHFPIRKAAPFSTIAGHIVGSIIFSLGHYTVLILLRKVVFFLDGRAYGSPISLISNLIFEYQKDIKIYLGIVVIVTIYRMFLGGENRLQLRPKSAQKILVQTGSGQSVLRYDQIDYLESARNYVVVHADEREYLVRNTMSALLDKLADGDFVRSHRSFAVNLAKVDELRSSESGNTIRLAGGQEIPLSRSYREEFKERLAGPAT